MSCGLVQLIKAGFVFEGGREVQQARTNKVNEKNAEAAWDAKFEQLKKCELPASRAQQVSSLRLLQVPARQRRPGAQVFRGHAAEQVVPRHAQGLPW